MSSVYTENDVLKFISEKCEGSVIKDDTLLIPDDDLSIKVKIIGCPEINGKFSAQILFYMEHPYFEQKLVESCAGAGSTANEAIEMCIENFSASVLAPVRSALKCENEEFISADIPGSEHIFRVPCTTGTLGMGGSFLKNGDLWELVKDVIPKYIGCKKAYWIKLFTAMTGDEQIYEARVNNIVCSGLTELLRQRSELSGEKTLYGTYKSFVLLIQKDETYEPCPYSMEQVGELTTAAIEKLMNVNDEESHTRAIQEIISSAPVESLGWEMAGLIPEMYCLMLFGIGTSDSIMYFGKNNGENAILRKAQLSSYDFIARAVYSYIQNKAPSREDNLKLLASSSLFQSIYKAILDGAKKEDLRCSDLMYTVCDNYRIY